MKKTLAILLACLLLAAMLPAAMAEEAELIWYGWTPGSPVNESFIEAFNQTYPDIHVTWKQISIDDYDATIKPKDDVFVLVNCPTSPEAAAVFNTLEPEDNSRNVTDPFGTIYTKLYRVDNAGNIEFPLVGFVKIDGLTIDQAQQTIKDKSKGYFKSEDHFDVYIELPSYSVSVVGEVNRPGMFTITNNKISVFEALARAGDMTIYGVRTDVKLIREQKDGRKDVYSLDITDANIINSPYYYMQQRDILYVQPNEAKSKNADIGNTAKFWSKGASIGISLASLIYSIVK